MTDFLLVYRFIFLIIECFKCFPAGIASVIEKLVKCSEQTETKENTQGKKDKLFSICTFLNQVH